MTWDKWVNALLGLWIIVSALISFSAQTLRINLIVTGVIIAAISLLTLSQAPHEYSGHA